MDKKRVVADILEKKHDLLRIKTIRDRTTIQELVERWIDEYLAGKKK